MNTKNICPVPLLEHGPSREAEIFATHDSTFEFEQIIHGNRVTITASGYDELGQIITKRKAEKLNWWEL